MATLFDSASLVMIPSGVKEDKLYSIKPTDGSGDFTFSRDADIEATRVNSSGLIEKAKVNLLTYSEDFSNAAWVKNNTTFSGDTLTANAGSSYKAVYQFESTQGVQVHYFDVAYVDHQWVQILVGTGGSDLGYINFDIQNKVIGNSSGVIDADIQDFGTYLRLVYVINPTNKTAANIAFIDSGSAGRAPASSSTGSFKLFRSQINHGLIAQDYVETTTTSVVEGLTADLPRLDYSGGASCPSLLLEPSRTNFIPHSEYFSDWALDGDGAGQSVTANYSVSPEGVQNAYRLQLDTTGGTYSRIRKSVTASYSGAGIFSVYLKTNDASTKTIRMRWSGSGDIQKTITGEWQRFDVQGTATSGLASDCEIFLDFADNDIVDLSVYGAVQEAGSYPTSYIPTYGTAANRGDDSCLLNNSSALPTSYPFTLYTESIIKSIGSEFLMSFLNASDNVSYASMYVSSGIPTLNARAGSSDVVVASPNSVSEGSVKIVGVFESSTLKLFVNGALKASISNTTTFQSGWNDLLIGQLRTITDTGDRTTNRQALVFPTALTDAEAIALTTI